MTQFSGGADWNIDTDGEPICICEVEGDHYHSVEWLMARDEYYQHINAMEQKAPDTGEDPVVGICGALVLILTGLVLIGNKMRLIPRGV